jgi:hypothetical protein
MFNMLRLAILVALISTASADCTRAFLQARGSDYLAAQSSGKPAELLDHTDPSFTYVENNIALSPSGPNSTLTYPLKIDYDYTIYDTGRCATFIEIVSASDSHPYGIHTRIEYEQNDGPATFLESVVTDRGDWLFNASMTLKWITQESWLPIPK